MLGGSMPRLGYRGLTRRCPRRSDPPGAARRPSRRWAPPCGLGDLLSAANEYSDITPQESVHKEREYLASLVLLRGVL